MNETVGSFDRFDAPMEIAWTFSYEIDVEKLRNLYQKAKRHQWDAEEALDWDTPIDPSKPIVDERRFPFHRMPFFQRLSKTQQETFVAHATAQLLSQFLHGEQGALLTASVLTHAVPDYEAKLYAATQTMDEARHVETYDRYIRKLAIVYPISPWLKGLIDETLTAKNWVKTAIGMNMVIEGLALAAFHNMRRQSSCPLLRQLTDYVLRDESRHVAFGHVYVRKAIEEMHPDDREDVAEFAYRAVKSLVDSQGGPDGSGRRMPDPGFATVLERSEIEPRDFLAGLHEANAAGIHAEMPAGQVHSFRDLMMPALVRVGAITERTRALYAEAEIPIHEDASVLDALQGSDAVEDGDAR